MADAKMCACGHIREEHDHNSCTGWTSDGPSPGGCACKVYVYAIPNVDTTATRAVHDQPPPKAEDLSKPAVWPLVIIDMCERDRVGRARYGTPLQPNNGRDALKDAYQEALDLAAYLRQAIYERDGK